MKQYVEQRDGGCDAYLIREDQGFEEAQRNQPPLRPDLRQRLERAREKLVNRS